MTNNFTLLYVEDDDLVRENFTEIFQTFFKTVLSTDNGDEALKIYETNSINVAILDVNINGLDGISVATKLRENANDDELIILMISAYSDREKLLRAINLQLFGYLIKPVKHNDLFTVLNNIVDMLHEHSIIALGGEYTWDESTESLLHKDEELKLTKHEKMAIKILLQNKNSYLSACEIQEKIFAEKELGQNSCNNIVQLLSRLKKKMDTIHTSSEYFVENCYGIGYRITIN